MKIYTCYNCKKCKKDKYGYYCLYGDIEREQPICTEYEENYGKNIQIRKNQKN